MTLGTVRLVGPGGVTVEHVTYTDKLGYTRRVLRLKQRDVFVGDFRMVEELGKHVDVGTLREESDEDDGEEQARG